MVTKWFAPLLKSPKMLLSYQTLSFAASQPLMCAYVHERARACAEPSQLCLTSFQLLHWTPKRVALCKCCVLFSRNEKVLIPINKQEKRTACLNRTRSLANGMCVCNADLLGGRSRLSPHSEATHLSHLFKSQTEENKKAFIFFFLNPTPNPSLAAFLFLFLPQRRFADPYPSFLKS